MQRQNDIVMQLCVACLGAGVITTVAVAQGQNPLTALGITLFSAIAAVKVGQVLSTGCHRLPALLFHAP